MLDELSVRGSRVHRDLVYCRSVGAPIISDLSAGSQLLLVGVASTENASQKRVSSWRRS